MNNNNFKISKFSFIIIIIIILFAFTLSPVLVNFLKQMSLYNQIPQLIGGLAFTCITICFIKFISVKYNKNVLSDIGVKFNSNKSMYVTFLLPIILFLISMAIGLTSGTINNLSFSNSPSIWSEFLLNILVAFLFEAFPEEVLMRGVLHNELKKKFSFF